MELRFYNSDNAHIRIILQMRLQIADNQAERVKFRHIIAKVATEV